MLPAEADGRSGDRQVQRSAGRWARLELTDQVTDGVGHTKTARGPASEPSGGSAPWELGRPGVPPGALQFSVSAALRRKRILRFDGSGAGGDEETRTPDPLLAKEMLCQLSYVPLPEEWWWAFLDSNQRPLPYQGSALTS